LKSYASRMLALDVALPPLVGFAGRRLLVPLLQPTSVLA
jgi:hypothetical protein